MDVELKHQQLESTSSFSIILGQPSFVKRRASFTKNVCSPWLPPCLKYKYTEQIKHQVDTQEMLDRYIKTLLLNT